MTLTTDSTWVTSLSKWKFSNGSILQQQKSLGVVGRTSYLFTSRGKEHVITKRLGRNVWDISPDGATLSLNWGLLSSGRTWKITEDDGSTWTISEKSRGRPGYVSSRGILLVQTGRNRFETHKKSEYTDLITRASYTLVIIAVPIVLGTCAYAYFKLRKRWRKDGETL